MAKNSWMYLFAAAFACVTILAACGQGNKQNGAKLVGSEHWETTAFCGILPQFLEQDTQLSRDLYSEVQNHSHIMKDLNCYCGCMHGTSVDEPHDSLLRCYWAKEPDENGQVVWTDHSTSCGICKKEMQMVVALQKEGKTKEQIIQAIDDTYKPN